MGTGCERLLRGLVKGKYFRDLVLMVIYDALPCTRLAMPAFIAIMPGM